MNNLGCLLCLLALAARALPVPATITGGRRQHFLQEATGSVAAGNFSYYGAVFEGPLTVLLRSSLGDADLYVAGHDSLPTWHPSTYLLQSATCGDDVVYVPATFRRPLHIAAYGHPSHPLSKFTLRLYCHHQTPDGSLLEGAYAGGGAGAVDVDDLAAKGAEQCSPTRAHGSYSGDDAETLPPQNESTREEDEEGWTPLWTPLVEVLGFLLMLL